MYGENCRIMHGEDTDMDLIRQIDKKLWEGTPVNEVVLNYKKDGTPFWNELVIQPIVDEKGENLFTASFILDVTNRKKDEALLKLQKQIFTGINEGEELGSLLQRICDVIESFFPADAICSILLKEIDNGWVVGAAKSVPGPVLEQMLLNGSTVKNVEELMIVEDILDNPGGKGVRSIWLSRKLVSTNARF